MADVMIALTEAAHQCLLHALSDRVPVWKHVKSASATQGSFVAPHVRVVKCSLVDAMTLLTVAERQCPDAVQPIRIAIAELGR
jgi:hypothetical protein